MTRKQMTLMVLLCAVVSALVSLTVVAGAVLILRDKVAMVNPEATSTNRPVAGTEQEPAAAGTEEVPANPEPGQTPEGATSVIHTVVAGDTISGLSLQYDVPAEDIISANQIQNPNFLTVGARLVIPLGGVEQVEMTAAPAPTATDTPIPFEPPSAQMTATAAAEAGATATPLPTPLPITGELVIEIVEVVKPGVVAQEGVTFANRGSRLADMSGWTISDAAGNSYTFPSLRLWAGGTVTVFTRAGQDGSPAAALYWGKTQAMWSSGETATLKNTDGKTMAEYTVP
ncbi:MAG TPA: lamin tail domain-containing protein [Anaerolineae bacterium]|nr:lamin tail domain-containing protein [Anaerolineae bacterium]